MSIGPNGTVRRNQKGGVYVSHQEVKQTIEFFDTAKKGYITVQDLKDKLGIFYNNLTQKDFKFLMQNKTELTEQDLYQLLAGNELTDFDPVKEAFKIYAPDGEYLDNGAFKHVLAHLGFDNLTDDDIMILVHAMDKDRDQRVGLQDFRLSILEKEKDREAVLNAKTRELEDASSGLASASSTSTSTSLAASTSSKSSTKTLSTSSAGAGSGAARKVAKR